MKRWCTIKRQSIKNVISEGLLLHTGYYAGEIIGMVIAIALGAFLGWLFFIIFLLIILWIVLSDIEGGEARYVYQCQVCMAKFTGEELKPFELSDYNY